MINFPLQWHPRFSLHQLLGQGALFISETDEFFIKNEEFELLNEVISANGRLSDYVFQESNPLLQVGRINRVDELVKEKILCLATNKIASHITPDFNHPILETTINDVAVYSLTKGWEEQTNYLERMCNLIKSSQQTLVLVMVDDYLDPRLSTLNLQFRDQKQNWLILKTTGDEHRIGPVFRNNNSDSACYQCLKSRLVQNKPVREWYRRYRNAEDHSPTPCKHDIKESIKALTRFQSDDIQLVFNADEPTMYQLDTTTGMGEFHPVTKRPQCHVCGDEHLFATMNHPPLALKQNIKNLDTDGGYRCKSRKQTLAEIEKIISPITGIISNLQEISEITDEDNMAIYRAAYFQNSYQTATISADTFVQLSLGKGVAPKQAQSSALGEALERQAAQYVGDEKTVYAPPKQLPYRACVPQILSPFSEHQYEQFKLATGVSISNPQWVKRYQETTAIHWSLGWSYSNNQPVFFPAAYCFANTPFEDHVYSLYNHNGNAAGNTNEEAILQGALEVIERDAVAIWWYNQIPRPEIDFNIIAADQRDIIESTLQAEWDYWLLDISNNIDAVSCVAVGQHKESEKFVLGFGSHLDPAIACSRALTEMYQLIIIKDEVTGPFDFNAIEAHPFLFPKRNTEIKTAKDYPIVKSNSIRDDILYLIDILNKCDLELCVVSYSRPDICLKTLKVIVPGLCHFWPQFANTRLFQVPVAMGWLSKPMAEHELNSMDLYL